MSASDLIIKMYKVELSIAAKAVSFFSFFSLYSLCGVMSYPVWLP
jgi:hypothetical protein